MPPPTVSVLVPTYNYARYLPEALDSILSQDLEDFELIVVDDRSEDGTDEILRRYERLDGRVRCSVQPERMGMVENWNDCLRRARGRYVKYVFADDRLARRDALRRLVDLLETHPQAALAASAREIIDADSRCIGMNGFARHDVVKPGPDVVVEWVRHQQNRIGEPTAVLFRREQAARGFDTSFRQLVDFEMWLHLLQRGDLVYVAECLCSFRKHESQQTERNRARGVSERERAPLLATYGRSVLESCSDRTLFELSYRVSKLRPGPERERLRKLVREHRGARRWSDPLHYLRYKIRRPFENLSRAVWKHAALRKAAAGR